MAGRGRGLTLPAWMTDTNIDQSNNVENTVLLKDEINVEIKTSNNINVTNLTTTNTTKNAMSIPLPPPTFPRPLFQPPPVNHILNKPPPFLPPPHSLPIPPPFIPPYQLNPPPIMPYGAHMFQQNTVNQSFSSQSMIPQHMGIPVPPSVAPNLSLPPNQIIGSMNFSQNMLNSLPGSSISSQPTAPGPVVGDPNNDLSCWTEYSSDEGRKYWYNKITLVSTYDKPFCLKTPEERSIPACKWKEYSADGKKYYSDGNESLWIMPEEFRIWKEKVDAVEAKKTFQPKPIKDSLQMVKSNGNLSFINVSDQNKSADSKESENLKINPPTVVLPTYASYADAAEAFKDLLYEKKVSTVAKMKEAQDICQIDVRWEALKSVGEKKQALAEYQTKRLKQEKEIQKNKARKHRDAFLLMLAENTDIDARTRWRDAINILQEDARYKNVEDARDREELFKDFILELEKKEMEDKRQIRDNAISQFKKILVSYRNENKIVRKSIWVENKKLFVDIICKSEFRSMDDIDFRRVFQDFMADWEDEYRKEERRKLQEFNKQLDLNKLELKSFLVQFAKEGIITPETRSKDILADIESSDPYKAIQLLCSTYHESDSKAINICREVCDEVLSQIQNTYRSDKRLIKTALNDNKIKVRHDSTFSDIRRSLLKIARLKEVEIEKSKTGLLAIEDASEEGEEPDNNTQIPFQALRQIILERPKSLEEIFKEIHDKVLDEYKEDQEYTLKLEKKYNAILAENFYSLEHLNISWDEAKITLQKRSVYDALGKSERKRLFTSYMQHLSSKFSRNEFKEHCENSNPDYEITKSSKRIIATNSLSEDHHTSTVTEHKVNEIISSSSNKKRKA